MFFNCCCSAYELKIPINFQAENNFVLRRFCIGIELETELLLMNSREKQRLLLRDMLHYTFEWRKTFQTNLRHFWVELECNYVMMNCIFFKQVVSRTDIAGVSRV